MSFDVLAVPANYLVAGLAGLINVPVAAAIVLATLLIRLALVPIGVSQHRADQRRHALMATVASLRERYVNSPKRLESELTRLYRAEGGALARGCLPMLVQIPVFAALYQLFVSPTVGGQANVLLAQTLFGVPLGSYVGEASGAQVLVFAAFLALLAAIGYVSSRLLRPAGAQQPHLLLRVLPYTTAVFALFVPLAASLYLVTTTAWTVAQTVVLRHWLG